MAKLSTKQRDSLPASDFAVPGKRALPIHDEHHVRLAWDMVDRTQDLSQAERTAARRRILRRARKLGIDTGDWHSQAAMQLFAMALAVPETPDHPNKAPFSGVLTRVDEPSDAPIGGSNGKRVLVTRAAAEAAIPTLLGMAIDFTPGLDGHDPQRKIGIITAAEIEGSALTVKGFFYAADFPKEVQFLRANKAGMGFSYEILPLAIRDHAADPMVVTELVFTGAAVLWKQKGGYHTTSLAANANKEFEMTTEELKALLAEGLAPIAKTVTDLSATVDKLKSGTSLSAASVAHLVKPHADALHAAADAMCAAGVGAHPSMGHAMRLHKMADHMMAEAHMGTMPHVYRDHDWPTYASAARASEDDPKVKELAAEVEKLTASLKTKDDEVAALGTKVKDLEANAAKNVAAPERKTLSPAIAALMARGGIELPEAEGGKLAVGKVDEVLSKTPLSAVERMQFKAELRNAGMLN